MQKIITITSHTNILEKGEKFLENEYPELNKYLSEGYEVIQIMPIISNSPNTYTYSVIFLLPIN